ncbi:MAG TPA: hypothetical protein IAB63_07230 [Candidatus Onthocola gallistercoris]|uniref:Uncharacterized protein n=1 Tax=Candidatus Onthocola gallistercoris TaxID=2840876 RepID=A0A9D1HGE5_9FIRM|nr:hypothetical protein [Candidatus Onthocola gallistercoris]
MTDMEKKVMLRLCVKVIEYVNFETDPEADRLVNWVILDNQRKQNNNEIRSLMAEYKKSEPERRESIQAAIKRGEEICDRRNELYETQQEIKHKLWKLEQEI